MNGKREFVEDLKDEGTMTKNFPKWHKYIIGSDEFQTLNSSTRNLSNISEKERYLSGKWAKEEEQRYWQFILKEGHRWKEAIHKKRTNFFIEMSRFVITRSPTQCRSHDQKIIHNQRKFSEKFGEGLRQDPAYEPERTGLNSAQMDHFIHKEWIENYIKTMELARSTLKYINMESKPLILAPDPIKKEEEIDFNSGKVNLQPEKYMFSGEDQRMKLVTKQSSLIEEESERQKIKELRKKLLQLSRQIL
jgi:hypothetical protein